MSHENIKTAEQVKPPKTKKPKKCPDTASAPQKCTCHCTCGFYPPSTELTATKDASECTSPLSVSTTIYSPTESTHSNHFEVKQLNDYDHFLLDVSLSHSLTKK
jgi:hypothetical protein